MIRTNIAVTTALALSLSTAAQAMSSGECLIKNAAADKKVPRILTLRTLPNLQAMATSVDDAAIHSRSVVLKAGGVLFGRKLKLTPHQRPEALARREAGGPLVEIGRISPAEQLTDHGKSGRFRAYPSPTP